MAFDVIFNDSEAACAVRSRGGSGESIHFARICVKTGSMKRSSARRSAEDGGHGGCTMFISVWDTKTILSSRSVAKSLNLTYRYQHHFRSWKRARILAIGDVFEAPTLIHSTFVVLAVYGRQNRFGTILCRITDTSTEVLQAVNHDEEPVSAVITRGPSLLFLDVSGVMFLRYDGKKSIIYSCDDGQNAVEHWTIGNCADDDSRALICTYPHPGDFSALEVSAVHWKGMVVTSSIVRHRFGSRLSLLAASLQRGVFLFSTAEGYLYAFDYNTQDGIWRSQKPSAAKDVRCATVYKDFLVLTTSDESEDVYCLDLRNLANPAYFLKSAIRMDLVVVTEKIERQVESESSRPSSGNPSLLQIEKNLESRLQKGLDRFLEHSGRIADKKQLLNRILVLLKEEVGSSTTKPFVPMFKHSLKHVASVRNRRESGVRNEDSPAKSLTSEHEQLEGSGSRRYLKSPAAGVLKLVNNTCGLDCARNFLTIRAEIAFHESEYDRDVNTVEGLFMKLNFSCSDRIPTVWSFNEVPFTEKPQSYSLYGFAPLAVFAHSSKLPTLTCSARVTLSNGCSQIVGLFTIASILSSNYSSETAKKAAFIAEPSFKDGFHIIARGLAPGQLAELCRGEDTAQNASIASAENLPRFTLNSKSRNDLATTIARLAIRAGDKVKFYSSPEPSRSALYGIDTAINHLQDEKKLIQVIGSQTNAYGYTPADIVKVLQKQIDVDEAFGLVEEQQLWF
ncbi:hypothetical protein BWQ96_05620 [Gracilariopsis chorda]|uniref:Uncharacterized protein n=1 Tax=Gracilariopsis chorda TaxID=448386 RepID=A0A2V3IR72_9FLOR|nr:hypothetical protein BWQ96_05620 [Gracilariopsis chorda]|eukprot:PXF44625.1 hypothetical protein BWQ96_05620 [Gracilariopsis chorda]